MRIRGERECVAWLGQVIWRSCPFLEWRKEINVVGGWVPGTGQDREMGSFSILPKLDPLRMASLLTLKCCQFPEQAIYPH